MKPNIRILTSKEVVSTRVCDISFVRNDEHEMRAIMAWRKREHPSWSQHAVSFRVKPAKRLRAVR